MNNTASPSRPILVEISPGELWDKITILRIKAERIADAGKLANVQRELAMLEAAGASACAMTAELNDLVARLGDVNRKLWDVEDDLRQCERRQDFTAHFIELARSVYRLNDVRGDLKRRINDALGASIREVKQYAAYRE
jgi:hypothetical protein